MHEGENEFTVLESEFTVLDVLGVLCNSFLLVAVMEGGQPDVEPQSSMPTRAPQVPDQVPLSTGNTSAKTGASKMCVCCVLCHERVCARMHLCVHTFMCIHMYICVHVCVCVYLPMCAY